MDFDFDGALKAGARPEDIVSFLKEQGYTKFDFDGAAKAGYSPAAMVNALREHQLNPPDTSYSSAFLRSLADPVQTFGTTAHVLGADNVGPAINQLGQSMAPKNYEGSKFQWDDPTTYGELPRAAVEQTGQLIGSLASKAAGAALGGAIGSIAGPVGAGAGALAGGFGSAALFNAMQVLGPVAIERAKNNGRTSPNEDDIKAALATAVASGAIDAATLGGGKAASGLVSALVRRFATEGAGEGAQEYVQMVGESAGTDKGLSIDHDRAINAGIVGGFTGGMVEGGQRGLRAAGGAVSGAVNERRAGEDLRAYQAETAGWTQAYQQAAERARRADPNVDPETLHQFATQQAEQSGATPPTFDKLSPEAQNGMAELAALQMYQARREAETVGIGRPNLDPRPSVVFKGVMDQMASELKNTGKLLKARGLLDDTQHARFTAFVEEARRHNRNAGDNAAGMDFYPTLREQVRQMGLPQSWENTILAQGAVLDVASQNSLENRAKGFLERHAGAIHAGLGALGGFAMGGPVGGVAGGALGNQIANTLGRGATAMTLRAMDERLGNRLPPILQRQQTIENFANRHGLQAATTPGDLMAIQRDLQQGVQGPPQGPMAPLNTLNQGLQAQQAQETARAQALAEAIRAQTGAPRLPGWAQGIAQFSGLHPVEVTQRVSELANANPELQQVLQAAEQGSGHIPLDVMKVLTDHLQNQGYQQTQLPPQARPGPTASGTAPQQAQVQVDRNGQPIRNQTTYNATVQAAQDARNQVAQQNPALQAVATTIGNARSQPEKQAIMRQFLAGVPASDRARVEAILAPLTGFGPLEATPTPGGPQTPPTGPTRAPGGMSPRSPRQAPGADPLGVDMTRRSRLVAGAEAMGDGRRFKHDWTTPGERRALRRSIGALAPEEEVGPPIAPPAQGHNGGPALEEAPLHPDHAARLAHEDAAAEVQRVATNLFSGLSMTPAETQVLLPTKLDKLAAGEGAKKRNRSGVEVADNELMPEREAAGMPVFEGYTPETSSKIADLLYKEALYHLSKTGSALGWYDTKLKTSLSIMAQEFPELASDLNAASTFKAILAITSNGLNVVSNFDTASRVYASIRERIRNGDYSIPEDFPLHGKTAPAQAVAFKTWNTLLREMGIADLQTFLTTKYRVREIERMGRELTGDPKFEVGGEGKNELVYGAAVLGPKIGNGFLSNLFGKYDMTTMDRWFMTTISRLAGTMVLRDNAETTRMKADRLSKALAGIQQLPDIAPYLKISDDVIARAALGDVEATIDVANALWTIDNRQGFPRVKNQKRVNLTNGKGYYPDTAKNPEKNETSVTFDQMLPVGAQSDLIRKAAKRLIEGFEGERALAPTGPEHRKWLRSIMDKVVGRLNSAGIPITHADLQAVIWFPEQRYWQRYLGVGTAKTDADYEDGAVIHAIKNGLEANVRAVYARQGYSPSEIEGLINRRKELMKNLKLDDDGETDA